MKKFWFVWTEKGMNPSRKHKSYAEAKTEAKRLAEKQPNCEFYVLRACGSFIGRVKVSAITNEWGVE
jgi:hypothetical protein